MLTKFWEGIGSKLSERFIAAVFSPAFAFWLGGALAWAWRNRNKGYLETLDAWANRLDTLPIFAQVALVILALLGVTASGFVAQRLSLPVLRLLEGYWPGWLRPLRDALVTRKQHRFEKWGDQWQKLQAIDEHKLTRRQYDELVDLEDRLRGTPSSARVMPTRLGNILRAAEGRPEDRYGLDGVRCWPRLWLMLPDTTRTELTTSRGSLDASAVGWLWSALFVVWTPLAWWAAPVGIAAAVFMYRELLTSAEVFGELFVSAYDLHRSSLYEATRWPLPSTPAEERQTGSLLDEYLWRGSDADTPKLASRSSV